MDTPNAAADEGPGYSSWRPEILNTAVLMDRMRVQYLQHEVTRPILVYDTIGEQLRDLAKLVNPSKKFNDEALDVELTRTRAGPESAAYGRWIYYPWSRRLVHVLSPEQFCLVRNDRNRHKITAEEQERLGGVVAGIVGLSVGNAVALTLALEGTGILRLADHDALDLSNLNRLQAGIHEIGVNKAVLAARQIYETNPYAEIEVFEKGLTETNIDHFILGPPRLDVLIDECDSLDMKILMRERAREHRIPVLMATSDRGMLDVERFDLEPDRPALHGRVGELRSAELTDLTTDQKVPHVLRILAPDEISAQLAASMIEIGRTVTTWPQIASEVQLGGAAVTTAVRHLAFGLPLPSGRRYIGLADLVGTPHREVSLLTEQGMYAALSSQPASLRIKAEIGAFARWLAEHAALAPSAGNCQPWRFAAGSTGGLVICHDQTRIRGGNWRDLASYFAIGAAVENAIVAAASLGRDLSVVIHPPNTGSPLAVELRPIPGGIVDRDGAAARLQLLRLRATNRRFGDGIALSYETVSELEGLAESSGAHLQFASDPNERLEIGRILGIFDRLQFTNSALRQEFAAEIRWSAEETRRTRDGIDVSTLELEPAKIAALRLMMRPDVAAILRTPGLGRRIEEMASDAMMASSAVGLLRIKAETTMDFLEAGRAMQRIWLETIRLGLGIQPWTAITFVSRMLDRPEGNVFDEGEKKQIRALSERLDSIFTRHPSWARALLFRIHNADAPTARSVRRDLDEVFM